MHCLFVSTNVFFLFVYTDNMVFERLADGQDAKKSKTLEHLKVHSHKHRQ